MKYSASSLWFLAAVIIGILAVVFSGSLVLGAVLFVIFATPGMLEIYIPYAKDNPNNLWFKRKIYGWGWTPVRWQGWLVIFSYIAFILWLVLDRNPDRPSAFALPLVLATIMFFAIAYKKGEKPHWQWGVPEDNKRD